MTTIPTTQAQNGAELDLLPCPFCGSDNLSIDTNSVQPDNFHDAWVVCGECEAQGRHAMTLEGWLSSKDEAKAEAVIAWNRRATAPHAATQPEKWATFMRNLANLQPEVYTPDGLRTVTRAFCNTAADLLAAPHAGSAAPTEAAITADWPACNPVCDESPEMKNANCACAAAKTSMCRQRAAAPVSGGEIATWQQRMGPGYIDGGFDLPEEGAMKAEIADLRAAVAAAKVPTGFVLMPMRLTQAMRDVLADEEWQWPDFLAAAEAITEDEYNQLIGNDTLAAPVEQGQGAAPKSDFVQSAPVSAPTAGADELASLRKQNAELLLALRQARECLMDVVSHHGDFRTACDNDRQALEVDGDRDAASYWQHQINVLDRMRGQAEIALAAIDTRPAANAAGQDAVRSALLLLATATAAAPVITAMQRHALGRAQVALADTPTVASVPDASTAAPHPVEPGALAASIAELEAWLETDGCEPLTVSQGESVGLVLQELKRLRAACPECKGTGMADSGGVQPWGEPALIACGCDKAPTADAGGQTPEIDALMAKWDDDGATRGAAFIELRDKARQLERCYYIVLEQCRELVNQGVRPAAADAAALADVIAWIETDEGLCQAVETAANIRNDDEAFIRLSTVKKLLRPTATSTATVRPIHNPTADEAKLYRDLTGDAMELGYDGIPAALDAVRRAGTSAAALSWVSVADRLPEDCQDVLVLCPDTGCEPAIWSAQYLAGSKTFESNSNGWADLDDISHWMPRPATPQANTPTAKGAARLNGGEA